MRRWYCYPLQAVCQEALSCFMVDTSKPTGLPTELGFWWLGDTRSWWRVPSLLLTETSHLPGLLLQLCIMGRGDAKGW